MARYVGVNGSDLLRYTDVEPDRRMAGSSRIGLKTIHGLLSRRYQYPREWASEVFKRYLRIYGCFPELARQVHQYREICYRWGYLMTPRTKFHAMLPAIRTADGPFCPVGYMASNGLRGIEFIHCPECETPLIAPEMELSALVWPVWMPSSFEGRTGGCGVYRCNSAGCYEYRKFIEIEVPQFLKGEHSLIKEANKIGVRQRFENGWRQKYANALIDYGAARLLDFTARYRAKLARIHAKHQMGQCEG